MITPENYILDHLIIYKNTGSAKHFRTALMAFKTSKHRINFDLLSDEIKLKGLQKEWKLLTDIEFTLWINF